MVVGTEVEQMLDEIGTDGVVGVDEGDILAFGDLETGVAGGREAGVFLVNDTNTGVALGVNITKSATHVGGAVVDEDNF